jgi:ubiquinone/menaquinone biosynthesis C-methylase UbiE
MHERMHKSDDSARLAAFLDLVRCPISHEPLVLEGEKLVSSSGTYAYEINAAGVPLFAREWCSDEARIQQAHYDRVASAYLDNLGYPHTEEYMKYWDRVLLDGIREPLDTIAEICCGAGEATWLMRERARRGVGVDISTAMLARARQRLPGDRFTFLQGDATRLPLQDNAFDAVFMLGGIHHVNNREALFAQVFRILKPGGRFYFREPLNDFFAWRWSRALIYRFSPALDADTEHPLERKPTVRHLTNAGFTVDRWQSIGFVASCFLMNSDVLVVNRLFRHVPGIRPLTRALARFDELCLTLPGMTDAGVAVSGVARKP